ncbi:hypothetical protein [Streptomyces syringium]|uniref:hypothetical protein n=1 Tax=Streptomyces syringium TaxID=76729 RepID=UPI0033E6E5EE
MPTTIPHITAREGETGEAASKLGVLPRTGLCYVDEGLGDRDGRGVLWARCSHSRDEAGRLTGAPRFGDVHPARQRECMTTFRCQTCVQPASRTSLGYLFLQSLPAESKRRAGWTEGLPTAQPPLCLEHAVLATKECAHLADAGFIALRSRRPRLLGVIGTEYQLTGRFGLEPVTDEDVLVSYGDARALMFLASQLVRRLCDVTVVDLAAEAEAAA